MDILVYVSVVNFKSCPDMRVVSFDYRRLVSLATSRNLGHSAHVRLLLCGDECGRRCVFILYINVFDLIHLISIWK
jgi:hypothetical protein